MPRYMPVERDQQFLMPPSVAEWLPKGDLAWFVIESTRDLDLESFRRERRDDGVGRPSFDPEVMVAVLLYAYARGFRSSRQIEKALLYDVGFRVVAANHKPDHSTIARFRVRFQDQLEGLFVGILGLCVDAGLVDPRLVVVDGTKMAADASGAKNVSREEFEEFIRQAFDEAERIDREEDELYGKDKRGDELRDDLKDPEARERWLKERLEELGLTKGSGSGKGRGDDKVNMTDPKSRVMKTPTGFVQGYNAQAVVTEEQIVVAAAVVSETNDFGQLVPMLTEAKANLVEAGSDEVIDTALADKGYLSLSNLDAPLGIDLVIAPASKRNIPKALAEPDEDEELARYEAHMQQVEEVLELQIDVLSRANNKEMPMKEAREALGLSLSQTYVRAKTLREGGPEALRPRRLPSPPRRSSRRIMLDRFSQPGTLELYGKRARTIEPVFGQLKHNRGFRRFMRRGLDACNSEFSLMMSTHNLLKLWRASRSAIA